MSQKLFYLLILLLPLQLGRHFWPEQALVFGIRVDYLSPTIYLTDIIIFLILLSWLPQLLKDLISKDRDWFIKLLPPIILAGIFFFFTVLKASNNIAASYKFIKLLEFLFLGVFIYHSKPKLSKAINFLSIALIYSSLIAIGQFIRQSSFGDPFWFLGERNFTAATPGISAIDIKGNLYLRPYATFPHPNVLGGFLAMGLTIIGFCLFTNLIHNKFGLSKKVFLLVVILSSLAALILTFSLSAFIALAIGFVLISWILRKNLPQKYFLLSGLSLILLLFIFEFFIKINSVKFLEETTLRNQLNNIALSMWLKKPLFGIGLNNFLLTLPKYLSLKNKIFWWQPAHNIYLLTLAETGLFGLIIFSSLIYFTQKKSFILAKQHIYLPFILLLQILTIGLFDHYFLTLQQGQLMTTIVFALAFLPKSSYTR